MTQLLLMEPAVMNAIFNFGSDLFVEFKLEKNEN